jgi:methyl-accepting chemotaxis protein
MLKNMKIGNRLLLAFGLVFLLMIIAATIGALGINTIARRSEQTINTNGLIIRAAEQSHTDLVNLRRYEKDYFLNIDSPQVSQDYYQKWNTADKRALPHF